jgi:hypothetical protein
MMSAKTDKQTTVDLTLDKSNDKIDHIRQRATKAATTGVLNGETPPAIGPKDLCITPIMEAKSNATCSTLKLSNI